MITEQDNLSSLRRPFQIWKKWMFNFLQCSTHLRLPTKFYNIPVLEYHEMSLISQYPKLEKNWVHLKMQTRFSHLPPFRSFSLPLLFPLNYFKYTWDNLWANWREACMEQKQHDIIHPRVIITVWNVTYDPSQRSFFVRVYELDGNEGNWPPKLWSFSLFNKKQGWQMCAINRLPEKNKTTIYSVIYTGTLSDKWHHH